MVEDVDDVEENEETPQSFFSRLQFNEKFVNGIEFYQICPEFLHILRDNVKELMQKQLDESCLANRTATLLFKHADRLKRECISLVKVLHEKDNEIEALTRKLAKQDVRMKELLIKNEKMEHAVEESQELRDRVERLLQETRELSRKNIELKGGVGAILKKKPKIEPEEKAQPSFNVPVCSIDLSNVDDDFDFEDCEETYETTTTTTTTLSSQLTTTPSLINDIDTNTSKKILPPVPIADILDSLQ